MWGLVQFVLVVAGLGCAAAYVIPDHTSSLWIWGMVASFGLAFAAKDRRS